MTMSLLAIKTDLPTIDEENLQFALGLDNPVFALTRVEGNSRNRITLTIDDEVFGRAAREWVMAELRLRAIKAVQSMHRTWDEGDGPRPSVRITFKLANKPKRKK